MEPTVQDRLLWEAKNSMNIYTRRASTPPSIRSQSPGTEFSDDHVDEMKVDATIPAGPGSFESSSTDDQSIVDQIKIKNEDEDKKPAFLSDDPDDSEMIGQEVTADNNPYSGASRLLEDAISRTNYGLLTSASLEEHEEGKLTVSDWLPNDATFTRSESVGSTANIISSIEDQSLPSSINDLIDRHPPAIKHEVEMHEHSANDSAIKVDGAFNIRSNLTDDGSSTMNDYKVKSTINRRDKRYVVGYDPHPRGTHHYVPLTQHLATMEAHRHNSRAYAFPAFVPYIADPKPLHVLVRDRLQESTLPNSGPSGHDQDLPSVLERHHTNDAFIIDRCLFELKYMIAHEAVAGAKGAMRDTLIRMNYECSQCKAADEPKDVLKAVAEELEVVYKELKEKVVTEKKAQHYRECEARLGFLKKKIDELDRALQVLTTSTANRMFPP